MTEQRDSQAGFTLIETLVALAVLAVGSVTLLAGVERHVVGVRGLSDRIVARWVAENAMAATTIGVELQPQWTRALARDWSVTRRTRPLERSDLQVVTVLVGEGSSANDEAALVSLTGYLVRSGGTP